MKPPKSWLVEYADATKKGTGGEATKSTRSFGRQTDDSFRHYMARKIELQRSQFGLVLPPAPHHVSDSHNDSNSSNGQSEPQLGADGVDITSQLPASSIINDINAEAKSNSSQMLRSKEKQVSPKSSRKRSEKSVRFDEVAILSQVTQKESPNKRKTKNNNNPFDSEMLGVVGRLKQKHGQFERKRRSKRNRNIKNQVPQNHDDSGNIRRSKIAKKDVVQDANGQRVKENVQVSNEHFQPHSEEVQKSSLTEEKDPLIQNSNQHQNDIKSLETSQNDPSVLSQSKQPHERPDLFFYGIVVLVNGYTDLSSDTIMRLLHKHGGDLEKYETARVTHIIAEHLSMAKANIYKRQKRNLRIPVVRLQWLLDCVEKKTLLPHADYLLDEVKEDGVGQSVKSFFQTTPSSSFRPSSEGITPLEKEKIEKNSAKSDRKKCSSFPSKESKDNTTAKSSTKNSTEKVPPNQQEIEEIVITTDTKEDSSSSSTEKEKEYVVESSSSSNNKAIPSPSSAFQGSASAIRTVGTDPNFLDSYFNSSRLSFIGSFKQRLTKENRNNTNSSKSSGNMTGKGSSSRRFVFHVDMDCFFAAVAIRNYPQYRNKPVAVGHAWRSDPNGIHSKDGNSDTTSNAINTKQSKKSYSELSTCNYVARKYGVKKGMFLHNARKLCPDLVVLPYDYDGYEEVSTQVGEILHSYAELYDGAIEQVSCDEAYLELFIDTDSNEETVRKIGERMRTNIFDQTQCTASVGIGANKLIAKLATDEIKPDGLCFHSNWKDCLINMKLRNLPGIGYRTEKKLLNANLTHVADVWNLGEDAEDELSNILGPGNAKKIVQFCNGQDDRAVRAAERRTIGAECNYGVRFDGPYGPDHMMLGLAKEVEKRMEGVGLTGRHITVKIKERKPGSGPPGKFNGMGSCNDHSKSCNLPCSTRNSSLIARVGMELFVQIGINKNEIRGMGIVISKLGDNGSSAPESQNMSLWLRQKKLYNGDKKDSKVNTTEVLQLDHRIFSDNEKSNISRSDTEENGIEALALHTAVNSFDTPKTKTVSFLLQDEKSKEENIENTCQNDKENMIAQMAELGLPRSWSEYALRRVENNNIEAAVHFCLERSDQDMKHLLAEEKMNDEVCQNLRLESKHSRIPESKNMSLWLNHSTCSKKKVHSANDDRQNDVFEVLSSNSNVSSNQEEDLVAAESEDETTTQDDLKVLRAYLDDSESTNEDDMAKLEEFLRIRISEKRLDEVVIVLRMIRRRKDSWGDQYETILENVNNYVCSMERRRLDLSWLGLK